MLTMSVTLSPLRSQDLDPMATDASPMAINLTPTVEQDEGEEAMKDMDSDQQYEKPPPLHTGADWKIVLHLPEIETWLRITSERVRDLTYSVQQDSDSKHVDVHLVQLKVRKVSGFRSKAVAPRAWVLSVSMRKRPGRKIETIVLVDKHGKN